MIYIVVFFLIGAGCLVYGIREQKEHFGEQQFGEGTVVSHQPVRSGGLMMSAVNAAGKIVNPVVRIDMPNGKYCVVPLHEQVSSAALLTKFPELDIGGRVSVTYFGFNPKEAFLTNHKLAQKPVRMTTPLLIGIFFLLAAVGLTVLAIFMYT